MGLASTTTPYRVDERLGLDGASAAPIRVRVAIADEQPLLMDGVAHAIDAAAGMRVIVRATSGDDLLDRLVDHPVDVVLLEPGMHTGDGLDAIGAVRGLYPETSVIALSSVSDPGHVQQAVAAGANAYVGKSTSAGDLPSIVRHVMAGALVLPGGASETHSVLDLTPRELEVLRLAAEGMTNCEIGTQLYVTEQTVKFHLGNIYRKLGVANRTEAAHQALRRGLIS